MSSTSARSNACVMNTILLRWSASGHRSSHDQVMQEMLHALDDRRPVRFLGDVDDAFHPQQIGTEILLQGVEQQPQRLARDGLFADETERCDVAVVQAVLVVVLIVTVMRMVVVIGPLLVGGGIEPRTHVGLWRRLDRGRRCATGRRFRMPGRRCAKSSPPG